MPLFARVARESAAPSTTADVAAIHDRLTRFLFANFHRKLTFEESSEAAAEALAEADRATAAGKRIENLDGWLCTAGWRNAISAVRRLEGEGRVRRLRPVDISEQGEWLLDERQPHEEVVARAGRRGEHEALAAAWARLKPDEQRAIYLRYFDELPVDEVLVLLGCSRHHYENLTKRAIRKLREALVEGVRDESCRACRTAIVESKVCALASDVVAARDAHLSSCLPCRAFSKRQHGLIAVLPLPAAGLVDRVVARLHSIGSGATSHPAEAAAGSAALAAAGTSAAGGGIGAGGLLGIGGAKGLAVLCSAGAATIGVCVTIAPPKKPPREPAERRVVAAKPRDVEPRTPPPVVAVATPAPSGATRATMSPAASAPPVQRTNRTDPTASRTHDEAARRTSSPFLPESAAPPPRDTMTALSAQRRERVTFSSAGSPAAAAAPSAPTSSTSSGRTAFSEEFTP
jgi:RNA polymerase sigma factor (sigma-70 family)